MITRRLLLGRLPLAALAVGLVLGSSAPAAFGHAAFLGSTPGPGARLEVSPEQITLDFTEPLNRRLTSVDVVRVDDGRVMRTRGGAASPRRLVARPAGTLAEGAYRLEWHSVSTEDGHALEGSFSFGVRAAAAAGTHRLERSPLARYGWLRVAARFLLYTTLLLFAGALVLRVLLGGVDGGWLTPLRMRAVPSIDLARVKARERAVIDDLGAFAAGSAVLTTLLEAVDAAQRLSPASLRDFLLTNVAGFGRVAVVLLILLALASWRRLRRSAGVLVAAALGAIAVSGHAGSATPRLAAVLNDWVHLLAGAVWLGGIGLIVLVWRPTMRVSGRERRVAVARDVLPTFGRVAGWAFVTVSATGLVSLLLQLGDLSNLWRTAYGQVLAVKITLVALIAAASWWHARRLRPRILASAAPAERLERRHWRLLRTEPLLGLAVAAAVGLLAVFPLPPRQLDEADATLGAQAACDPCPLPRPEADELAVAEHAGTQVVAGWLRHDRGRVTGTIRVYGRNGRPSKSPIRIEDARQRSCGPACLRVETTGETVRVGLRERGRRYTVALPGPRRPEPDGAARGRRLLERAQATMRGLRGVRQTELVTSGPGSLAQTNYRLEAPDRLSYVTRPAGTTTVVVGRRQWLRVDGSDWLPSAFGSGIGFSTRSWFRWTNFAQEVRVLRRARRGERGLVELALMDPGTPAWFRLTVEEATGRVLAERSITSRHFTTMRYSSFNRAGRVRVPAGLK